MKKQVNIIVNGRTKSYFDDSVNLYDLCVLAFNSYEEHPNRAFSATYSKGPNSNPSGSMSANNSIKIKEGMIFNVIATDKA